MRLPVIRGTIDRRLLVNYRVDPAVAARLVPPPFRPSLVGGFAVASICLIRLKHVRPAWFPVAVGIGSENAAHRFAVDWDRDGRRQAGVYIPRRDSSSRLNALLGGRLVPGELSHARFTVREVADRLHVEFAGPGPHAAVSVDAAVRADLMPGSVFASVDDASEFFRHGSSGYSATRDAGRFDGMELRCEHWSVRPPAGGGRPQRLLRRPGPVPGRIGRARLGAADARHRARVARVGRRLLRPSGRGVSGTSW